ncbi:hypothetical protein P4S93_14505 [Aneurinibacillus thermoaerophilus]|uniref:Uncharacterized protein n=1 Tax=Aneurinibacillus thermoaerophilus TaxID=143495 RepID=A0A1G8FNR0_ANETH|nr:hypothetical protein [Aneurinibacillus thermoaerophilus]MED0758304.1 hypothetical protein [Aneurinibacillus thermoaerophilus]MED0761969.1 hypothetical protein [Aneurinibacillus thermoaerophilus]SDH83803.1 hypothetical protein SAMN04489735_107511 [Aneurinibacillus thermoaerophilus]
MDEKKLAELIRSIIKEEMQEIKQVVYALRDGQEELKAQMESLSLDVHKLHGEVTAIKEDAERIHKRLDYQILRIARTEEELHLLKPNKQ